MKGANRKRALLVSSVVILLCMTIIIGMTFALFTDSVKLTNHLQAGTLDITLIRTNLNTTQLNNDTGFLVDIDDPNDVDFSEANGLNVFGLTDESLFVPGSMYSAEMQIINNTPEHKSDVAFGYWLEIVFDDSADLTLADQLKVTIVTATGTTTKFLSQLAKTGVTTYTIGNDTAPIGTLAKTGSALFTVTVEFCNLDYSVNNGAKNQAVDFDLIVHAVQVQRAPQ